MMNRERDNNIWLYGINPVLEALKSGRGINAVYIYRQKRDGHFLKVLDLIRSKGIQIKSMEREFFDGRFPKGHQGIAAIVAQKGYTNMENLIRIPLRKNEIPLFLILDCIEDPRNFGAILRVADAGGVHGVVIQSHRSAALSPEAIKASAGAAEYIPVAMVSNIKHAIKDMKENGLTIIGAEAGEGHTIWDIDLRSPLAFVLGSEGKGLRKTVKEDCDMLVNLPMKGMVNSLNVSVATGIVIFEIMRQRMK